MATYYPATSFVPQFTSDAGVPLSGGTITAFIAGTSTPTAMYIDSAGTSAGTSVTLNARGEPTVSGNTVIIWLDAAVSYKFVLKDASAVSKWTVDNISNALVLLANTSSTLLGDALVGVKRPTASAVARTQHDVNKDVASVYDFLEPGGDIGEAINNAVADAGTNGFELLIPPSSGGGAWELSTPVVISKPGFTLRGCGTQAGELAPSITPAGVLITQVSGANLNAMIKVTGSGFRGQNITLNGAALLQASGSGRGLWIEQTTGALPQLSFTVLDNFNVHNTRGQGIYAAPVSGGVLDRMKWYGVNIRDTYGHNVELQDVGDSEFFGINLGGAFNADAHNLQLTTCRRVKFFGGLCDFAGNGIGLNIYQGFEYQFFGMQVEAAGKHGWYIDSAVEVDLIACQARANGSLDADVYGGFVLAGTADKVRLSNCRAWDPSSPKTQDYGLILSTTGDASFENCDFEDNLTGPISSDAANFANKTFSNCRPYHSPAVNAYRNGAAQALANNTFVKIQFDTEETDTAGWFDNATNYRFQPLLPGNYTISWAVNFAAAAAGIAFTTLYKNGTRHRDGSSISLNSANGVASAGSVTVQANGTTDYFEVFAFQNSGGSIDAQVSAPTYPYFTVTRNAG